MIKNIIFGFSLVFAQNFVEINSEEFTSAVHQRILERREFWVVGTETNLHSRLVTIEEEMLTEYLEDNNLDSQEVSLEQFQEQVTKDREEQEIFYAEHYE